MSGVDLPDHTPGSCPLPSVSMIGEEGVLLLPPFQLWRKSGVLVVAGGQMEEAVKEENFIFAC